MIGETFEVTARSSPPLVDRLIGVTDGRDRERFAEQGQEEQSLGGVGVLVLVEEDDAIPTPDARRDVGMIGDEAMGEVDEI
jgi:hypothetical protein